MLRNTTTAGTLVLSSLLLATPALAQESATQIDVVDPGDEPRSELRYAWTEGLTGTTVIEADTTVVVTVNGQTASEEQMPLTKTITRTVTEVDGSGNARLEFSIQAPERDGINLPAADAAPGDAVDSLRAELAALSDYSGWMLLDPRGVVLDYGVDGLGQTYADLMVQTRGLGGEVQVLPEEPVGVGAEWESYTEIFESRLTYESDSTTTLAAVDGTTLTLEQEHSTSSQPNLGLERLGVSAGAIYTSQQVEGTASTELALDSLVQTGSGDVQFLVIAGTSAGGYGSELQIDMDMAITATAGE